MIAHTSSKVDRTAQAFHTGCSYNQEPLPAVHLIQPINYNKKSVGLLKSLCLGWNKRPVHFWHHLKAVRCKTHGCLIGHVRAPTSGFAAGHHSVSSSTTLLARVPTEPQHPGRSRAQSTKSAGREGRGRCNSPQAAEGKQKEESRALRSWASPCATSLSVPAWEILSDAAAQSYPVKGGRLEASVWSTCPPFYHHGGSSATHTK